jgi:ATP-binding protein involved in chromosome partitioning
MFQRVGVPVLGIIENMSWFSCSHCGTPTPLFGAGGGARLAEELGIPLLGEIPLVPQVMQGGESGAPIVLSDPASPASVALMEATGRISAAAAAPAVAP